MERIEVLDMMGELKLYGMRNAYDEALAAAVKRKHEPQHFVGDLLKAEISEKQARSIKYQLTIAKLPLHLGDGRRLHSALLLPCPELDNERRESENHEGVKGLELGNRDLAVPNNEIDGAVGMLVGPQRDRVALLLVRGPEHRGRQKQRD